MRKSIGYFSFFLVVMLATTACTPKLKMKKNTNKTNKYLATEGDLAPQNYSFKPEPYSLNSKEKDPELLGPQSTIKKSDKNTTIAMQKSTPKPIAQIEPTTPKKAQTITMNKERCIKLIGQTRYDKYTKQFGSETAALRKCIILQRVQDKH